MIAWWGPIIHEYYGATEGLGLTACDTDEWLAHKGSVGACCSARCTSSTRTMHECPTGVPGTIWFRTATPFEYFNDERKTPGALRRRHA